MQVVSVVLENYDSPKKQSEDNIHKDQVSRKAEGHISPSLLVRTKIPTWKHIVNEKGELNLTMYAWPNYLAHV